jgi:hypothetical protein
MFFADMVSGCGKRYKEKDEFDPVYIHPDEFNDVIGDDFIPMLNKAGGAGIVVTAYTQTDQDIELGFGGSSLGSTKALVAKGNFRTIASMRVATEETAEYFTQRLNDVMVRYSVQGTRFNDSNSTRTGESASTTDEIKTEKVKLIDAQSIMSLPVGQMFISKNGGRVYKVRLPHIDEDLTKIVGSIEVRGLGNMIREVNLGKFVFADEIESKPKAYKAKSPNLAKISSTVKTVTAVTSPASKTKLQEWVS